MAEPLVIYGGTFDPVHIGHMITARAVAEARGYEKILLLPAASPPHKPSAQAGPDDRLEMLRLTVADDPMFEVCDAELRRAGRSYTFDTLAQLREDRGADVDIHWIIGADMLDDLPNWHRAAEVVDQAQIVVAMRPPWHERIDHALANLADQLGTERARKIAEAIVSTPLIDISSTEIRRRAAAGLSLRYLVCPPVEKFIGEKRLYRP